MVKGEREDKYLLLREKVKIGESKSKIIGGEREEKHVLESEMIGDKKRGMRPSSLR